MEKDDAVFMEEALKEAKEAYREGEVPVGAVVVKMGEIVGRGRNHRENDLDISSHAEINALKDASQKLGRWDLSDCCLYVTLEPCLMCAGAILQSRIRSICFGAEDKKAGAITSNYHVFDAQGAYVPPLLGKNLLKKECETLLKAFFDEKRSK